MGFKKKDGLAGLLFLLPSLAGVLVFVLLPFGDVVRRSFQEAMSGAFVGLRNYQMVLSNGAFQLAAGNTLRFMGVCMPLLILLSLLVAVLLHSRMERAGMLKITFLLPMAIPVASVVLLWRAVFHRDVSQPAGGGPGGTAGGLDEQPLGFLGAGVQLYLEEPGL